MNNDTNTNTDTAPKKPVDERAFAYDPPSTAPRTGNAWLDYVNAVRVRNGAPPLTVASRG